ncbi:hypothetical protein ACIGZJ_31190 [Kitasatospora sp. NPDC052868]|uniref:hypothetical protein n=1 Tax=Kitasatospora sp. NPDC052868 TaxID=3364060 RepID=UPI0037CAD021
MKATIGRIVHYTSHGSPVLPDGAQKYKPLPRAAIVTAIPAYREDEPYDGCPNQDEHGNPIFVSLAVLNPTGMFFDECVPYSEEPAPGHWSWPPRA